MPRYFVVVQIPPETVGLIKTYFQNKFGKEMQATHVHMSLLPPFYLNEGRTEQELLKEIGDMRWSPFVAKFAGVRKSSQKTRNYLFLKVGPEESCSGLSLLVEKRLEGMITVDKTPYLNGVVPQFEAHVTIDYDFGGEVPSDFPEISFDINKISVAKEDGGVWVDFE